MKTLRRPGPFEGTLFADIRVLAAAEHVQTQSSNKG